MYSMYKFGDMVASTALYVIKKMKIDQPKKLFVDLIYLNSKKKFQILSFKNVEKTNIYFQVFCRDRSNYSTNEITR